MKSKAADRLSAHLLQEARRFMAFPARVRQSRPNLEVQRLFDAVGQQLVTQRETFMGRADWTAEMDPGKVSVFVDELYCRNLLSLIPEIVDRTLRLRGVVLSNVPTGHLLTYMKEATRTYAMGFFVASVALSRSAVEAALRPHVAKHLGATVGADLDLRELIDRAPMLDKPTRDLAHRVRRVGNDVIHKGKSVNAEDTLDVIEAARTVIVKVERR